MKKFFTLIAVAAMAFAAQANVLSVCQGEYQSSYAPVYGLWYDTPGVTQMIYSADMLAEMADGDITEVSFLTLGNVDGTPYGQDFSSYTLNFSGGLLSLALKEVDEVGFTETVFVTDATVVSTLVPEAGGYFLTFALDEPFHYNGGNLMVEVKVQEPGNYASTYFWGTAMYDENDEVIYTPTYMYNENYSGEANVNQLSAFLPAADFTYTPGTTPQPTEKTGAPVFNGYTTDGIHAYFIEINESEPSTIYYRVQYGQDGEFTEWAEYEDILSFTQDGWYRIEAYAVADGKLPSDPIAYEFIVNPATGLSEMVGSKTVANTRYFNVAGQEMQEANGLTIVVTTYTDGTTSTVKVMK